MDTKVALVFGATGGIGSEVAKNLTYQGYRVALVGRDTTKLNGLVNQLPGSMAWTADIRSSEEVKTVLTNVVNTLGIPTMIAHCVGSILLKPAHQIRDEEWLETLQLNLSSAFYVSREATLLWTRNQIPGSLVFCSSAAATIGLANHEAIAAAKSGLEGLVRSAAATYAAKGIRINAVAPGLVKTQLSSKIWNSEAALRTSLSLHPIKSLGTSAQIASAITWLLSPEQSWTTGQVLHVDGGLSNLKTISSSDH